MSEHLDKFLEGWVTGDVELLLSVCAEDFVYDDAIDGRVVKAEFPAYVESLSDSAMTITDVVTEEIDGLETAWCWWTLEPQAGAAFSFQEGGALFKVGRDGVHCQKVAYYTREPQIVPQATE